MSHYCDGKLVSIINRYYLEKTYWQLHYNHTDPSPYDAPNPHRSYHQSFAFNSTFWNQCSDWAINVNYALKTYTYHDEQVAWFGTQGTKNCSRSSAAHNRARGFDLTRIHTTAGYNYIDSNHAWRSTRTHRRRYVAMAASLRRYFGTVLTAWYNSAHHDHIHFDNLTSVKPIRTGAKSDVTLVQAACNEFNSAGLVVDGVWGSNTSSAYNSLRSAWNMNCIDPLNNVSHAKRFLWYMVASGLKNVGSSYYNFTGC